MMSEDNEDPQNRRLWQDLRDSMKGSALTRCPTDIELAEYLDGRAPPDAEEYVDAHLVQCEQCVRALVELRAPLREEAEPVALRPVERARALFHTKGISVKTASPPVRMRIQGWFSIQSRLAGWAALAASICGASYLGYWLGSQSYRQYHQSHSAMLAEGSFGTASLMQVETARSPAPGTSREVNP